MAKRSAGARRAAAIRGWETRRANQAWAEYAEQFLQRRRPVDRPHPTPRAPKRPRSTPDHQAPGRKRPPAKRSTRTKPVPPKRKQPPQRKRSAPKRKRPPPEQQRPPQRKRPKRRKRPPQKRPPRRPKSEFIVSIDYRAKKGQTSSVTAQISVIGPDNATREQIETAVAHKADTGRDARGYNVRFVDWRGRDEEPDNGERQRQLFQIFANFANQAETDVVPTNRTINAHELRDRQSKGNDEAE